MTKQAMFDIDAEYKIVVYADSRGNHLLTGEDLVKAGMDPAWVLTHAEAIEGTPDCDANVVVRWCRDNPLPLQRLIEVAEPPTDREITKRAKELQSSPSYVAELTDAVSASLGRAPSSKEMKEAFRDNAAAELIAERHQLTGLTEEARYMIDDEMYRQRLLGSGASEKEVLPRFGKGTDVFVLNGNGDEAGTRYSTRSLPLSLADDGTWEFSEQRAGEPVTGTYAFWRLPPPKSRHGRPRDNAVHRACRTGRYADKRYAYLTYYRKPTATRRGVIVAIPMERLLSILQFKYKFLVTCHETWVNMGKP